MRWSGLRRGMIPFVCMLVDFRWPEEVEEAEQEEVEEVEIDGEIVVLGA